MKRYLNEHIIKDLEKKMVFLVGPRQVGKTWLAQKILRSFQKSVYLNYDNYDHRKIIEDRSWLKNIDLIVFDEIHKMAEWKNYLKGLYDTKPEQLKILVTGSARLDTFRQAGDSLAGRFFKHRLLPFSPAEFFLVKEKPDIELLIQRGGFPEPYLAGSEKESDRWHKGYLDSLIRTDILDFAQLTNLRKMETIVALLRRRIGSPVSFKSIAEDVKISPTTVIKYIEILEALFIIFRVSPYSKNIARAILKEPKIYFYDNGLVIGDLGAKLENFAALNLMKHCYAKEDLYGKDFKLHYLRTKEGKEVDFCISEDGEIKKIIEIKTKDSDISKNLSYFSHKYNFEGVQIVYYLDTEYQKDRIEVRKAGDYFTELVL